MSCTSADAKRTRGLGRSPSATDTSAPLAAKRDNRGAIVDGTSLAVLGRRRARLRRPAVTSAEARAVRQAAVPARTRSGTHARLCRPRHAHPCRRGHGGRCRARRCRSRGWCGSGRNSGRYGGLRVESQTVHDGAARARFHLGSWRAVEVLVVVSVEHLERRALAVVVDVQETLPERVIAGELATPVGKTLHLHARTRDQPRRSERGAEGGLGKRPARRHSRL